MIKKGHIEKKIPKWAPRLWIGRRWEPIFGYISKKRATEFGTLQGYREIIYWYLIWYFIFLEWANSVRTMF